jgi:non-specific serine/threonine protein kinase
LDAVEQVCDDTQLAPAYLIDVLASLIDKSILIREDHDGTTRYRMLETLREYGAHRQAERREHDKIARRHRDYYATMAAHAEAAWTGPEQLRWARTLTREHANIQAAMEYCLREPAEVAAAQELAAHLWFFWIACGLLREGRYYLDRALDRGGEGRPRRWALWACAFAAGSQGDLDTAEDLARQCHTDANAAGDAQLATYATEAQAMTLAVRGDLDRAVELMHECLTYYHNLDRIDAGLLRTQPMLGVTLVMRGDLDAALALAPHSQQLCERLGERWQRSYVDYFVGMALRGKNQATRAVEHLAAAIETKHQFHDIVGIVMCLEPLAGAHADLHDAARAARLLGAAEQLRHSYGLSTLAAPFHTSEYQRAEQQARHLLGTQQYERAFHHGRSMNLDQIVACAVTRSQGPQLTAPTSNGPDPLTRRERQAAELVSQGLSNRDIAARLVISTRTAESHVHNIMTKLGFTNRAQLAAWVATYRHDHTPPTG